MYVPLRLSYAERKRLRLIESALNVSEYTDRVDVYGAFDKVRAITSCAPLYWLPAAHLTPP